MLGLQSSLDKVLVSYADPLALLSTSSQHEIELDGHTWPSVEHYVQAMKYDNPAIIASIKSAPNPMAARKIGNSRWKKKKSNWKTERLAYMARGMYTKCMVHPEVAEALLDTGDKEILDTTNYDYFWGCGRDTRGDNRYGKLLMTVRKKLLDEQQPAAE